MKLTLLILTIFAAATAVYSFDTEEDVLVLHDSDFDDAIKEHDILLVEFYAPWCGHCKKLAPEYAEAAGILKDLETPLYIAKVDATAEESLAKRFEIQGFPTLKLFKNGKPSAYEGGRTAKDIVNFMKKKSGPPATILADSAAFDKLKDSADVVVVGAFEKGSDEQKAFLQVAGGMDDVPFGEINDAAVAKTAGVEFPSVTVFQKFDDGRADYDGTLTSADDIEKFIGGNLLPIVVPFNQDTARHIFGPTQPIRNQLLVFANGDDAASLETVKGIAVANKGKTLFVHVSESEGRVLNYFGITEDSFPCVVFVDMPTGGAMKKFMPEDSTFDAATISKFVDDFHAGNLKPHLKSDPIPESQDEPVYVLVGKEFEKVALDDAKDVLVEFYAPWCGHCKALAPKYDELGEMFEKVDSVVIAKMDATANEVDHPDVNVQGFPTIKFFPANSGGKVMDYDGAREVDGFVSFLKANAGIKFELDASSDDKDEL